MSRSPHYTAALQQLPLWDDAIATPTRGAMGEPFWRVRRSHRARRRGERIAVVDASFPPHRLELRAIGETWRCEVVSGVPRRGHAELVTTRGDVLHIRADRSPVEQCRGLMNWLAERARLTLVPQLCARAAEVALAAEFNVPLRRVQIRWQRTRWGSCSTRGTVSLNGCLLFHRPEVVRYLYTHELAHLTHMNHSPSFWKQVASHEPNWREWDRELARGWQQVPGWLMAAL